MGGGVAGREFSPAPSGAVKGRGRIPSRNLSGCPEGGAGCGGRGSSLINPEGLRILDGGKTTGFHQFLGRRPGGRGGIPAGVSHKFSSGNAPPPVAAAAGESWIFGSYTGCAVFRSGRLGYGPRPVHPKAELPSALHNAAARPVPWNRRGGVALRTLGRFRRERPLLVPPAAGWRKRSISGSRSHFTTPFPSATLNPCSTLSHWLSRFRGHRVWRGNTPAKDASCWWGSRR